MPPRRPRRHARRRSSARRVILLLAAVIVLAVIVGGLTQVSRQSQGYDANADRSLAAQGTVVADQSNATSETVRRVVNDLQTQTRQGLQSTLDTAVQQTADQSSRADLAAAATPSGTVTTGFTTVFADRAESMRQLRAAVDGFLGMQPALAPTHLRIPRWPAQVGPRSSQRRRQRIASWRPVLCSPGPTRSYRSVRHSLAVETGHGTLPPSVWVTHPQVWQLGGVAAQVDLLATSPTLSATHDVVLRTVRLSPPALPTPQGASATVSVFSPTSRIGVNVVVANQGSSDESHVSIRVSLADQTTGATAAQTRETSLAPGASVTLPQVTMRVKSATTYVLTVQVIPRPARPSRPARPFSSSCRSLPRPERRTGLPRPTACRPHPFLVLGSERTEIRDWRALQVAESITITDNRNGESIEIPLVNGGVAAEDGPSSCRGCGSSTPASCRRRPARVPSPISTGTPGILRYRGYPHRAARRKLDLPRGGLSPT